MKKGMKNVLLLLTALTLTGCNQAAANTNSGGGSVTPGTITIKTPEDLLKEALEKDYSNCTVGTVSLYKESDDDLDSDVSEYDSVVYYYNGYAISYDETLAEAGYNPYLYYHDYNGDNLLFFNADTNGANKDAWLKEYENGTSYAMKYTQFYLPEFLNKLDVTKTTYYADMYYITDLEEIDRLNQEVFCGIWENDIQSVVITLSDGYIQKIYGYEEEDNDTEYCVISVADIGSTIFDESKLPEAPNEENVMEYWEYKGWTGPTVEIYPAVLEIETLDETIADTETVPMEIDDVIDVESTITWPEVEGNHHVEYHDYVTWMSSDDSVAKCSYRKTDEGWVRTILAVKEGECDIYAVAEGANEEVSYDTYAHGVTSNKIHIRVSSLAALDKTDAKYDLYFSSIVDNTLVYNNWVSGEAVEGTAETVNASLLASNELFYDDGDELNALILNPNNMQAEASVTFALDENVSKISFYYAMYYDHTNGLSHLKDVLIESSMDGENWSPVDVTEEVKEHISYENLKLMTVEVTSGNYIRITVESTMVGSSFAFATSNIVMF